MALGKHLVIGHLNEYQLFSAFHWSISNTPQASQYTCVYNRTVMNIENTVRAMLTVAAIAGFSLLTNVEPYEIFLRHRVLPRRHIAFGRNPVVVCCN